LTSETIDSAAVSPSSRRPGVVIRPPTLTLKNLPADLAKFWRYRDLLNTLTRHRISVRYKQSMLGVFWAVLQPPSMMLIFTFIFSLIARMPTGDRP
jgi:lipopolysaccharide transport system permease protein